MLRELTTAEKVFLDNIRKKLAAMQVVEYSFDFDKFVSGKYYRIIDTNSGLKAEIEREANLGFKFVVEYFGICDDEIFRIECSSVDNMLRQFQFVQNILKSIRKTLDTVL